ncbi:hypothetical protein ACWGI8_13120 [Streptomyces sp. NPDC054841]
MRPEGRAVSPPARRSWWSRQLATGGVTALAALSLAGALGGVPAQAQDHEPKAKPASAVVSTDKDKDKHKDKDQHGRPPAENACFDIDTVRQEGEGGGSFYAATSDGIAFVGRELSPLGTIEWDDLSDEGGDVPVGACGVSIDAGPTEDSNVVVDVITTSGTVNTIVCERTGSVIDSCSEWEERDAPEPGATP